MRIVARALVWVLLVTLISRNAGSIVAADNILCRRCGATVAQLDNALQDAETPPSTGSGEKIILPEPQGKLEHLTKLSNKVGQTFDLALFRSAQVRTVAATRSIQDSFYPGYAWRVAECPVCGAFLGWAFDRPAHCHEHDELKQSEETAPEQEEVKGSHEENKMDAETILDAYFATSCLSKGLGYWNIEWCHKKHVKQYHVPGPSPQTRDPEYSLGTFLNSKEIAPSDGERGKRYIEQTFADGQKCDETNGHRTSVIHLSCCAQYHNPVSSAPQAAFIASFREPFVCTYEIVVCVPALCALPRFVPRVGAETTTTRGATGGQSTNSIVDEAVCSSGSPPKSAPRWFYGFDYSALVCENGPEMLWMSALRPMIGTGQFQ